MGFLRASAIQRHAKFSRRVPANPGGDQRRRAGAGHTVHNPRHQLRPTGIRRGVCSPDRADCPDGKPRDCDQLSSGEWDLDNLDRVLSKVGEDKIERKMLAIYDYSP